MRVWEQTLVEILEQRIHHFHLQSKLAREGIFPRLSGHLSDINCGLVSSETNEQPITTASIRFWIKGFQVSAMCLMKPTCITLSIPSLSKLIASEISSVCMDHRPFLIPTSLHNNSIMVNAIWELYHCHAVGTSLNGEFWPLTYRSLHITAFL